MKRSLKILIAVCFTSVLSFVFLTSCAEKHTHEFGEWITVRPSTCVQVGVEERYCYCLEKQTQPAPLGEHKPGKVTNCLMQQYCTVCGETLAAASSHKFGDWTTVKEVTCTDDGWKEHLCTVCGKTEKQTIAHTGHQYSEWTVVREATCAAPGLREKSCACGIKTSETITVDHTGEWTVLKEPTKTEDGSRERTCLVCHEKITEILYAFGSQGLAYKVNFGTNTCTVTGIGTCTEADVVIPQILDGYTVTEIADKAFLNCQTMTSLMIPSCVEKIGTSIVSGATNLRTLYYNTDVACGWETFQNAWIKKVVFGGNRITWISQTVEEVVISESITLIPKGAFSGYSYLKSIVIPENVTEIKERAFADCASLTSIEIPKSVTSIGDEAFQNCTSLKTVIFNEGITKIGKSAFSGCISLTAVTVPDGVTEIGSHAFFGCESMKSAVLPKGLTKIENSLFYDCTSLSDLTIPEGVTAIEGHAFGNCTALTSIALPESLNVIQNMAFFYCTALTDIRIPEKVTSLNSFIFHHCDSLTEITLHNKLTHISTRIFSDCESAINIRFLGTMAEWEAISVNVPNNLWGADIKVVICTDGTITIQ